MSLRSRLLCTIFCCLLTATAGCSSKKRPQVGPSEPPGVPVSPPIFDREITNYVDFTGRTDAVNSVNIIARVTGYLVSPTKDGKMPFKEGSFVKKGDLLFEIDPQPYQAQFDQAQSQIKLYDAQLKLAQTTLVRFERLNKDTPGAVSQQALDQYKAAVDEAQARVNAQEKSLEVYKLNKEFTRVLSPIDGQVGRYNLTLGNLVNQDQTLLTTVVSLDPMYAYFEMDERTMQTINQGINEGRIKSFGEGTDTPVSMGLEGEEGFPHKGTVDFLNNQVTSATGSLSVRGIFTNPKPEKGVRLLKPGRFVRIRLNIGEPYKPFLVIDRAIQSDQGKKYVYVVDAEKKVQKRPVTTGALQEDGMRVISKGLTADDLVVVGALQQVHEGMTVRIDPRSMQSFGSSPDSKPADKEKGKKDSK
jgi:membrane fusion protein, multidrug efflux system